MLRSRQLVQIIVLAVLILLLIRFFPVVVRLGEIAALGLRQFWWVVLIVALGLLFVWMLRNRR